MSPSRAELRSSEEVIGYLIELRAGSTPSAFLHLVGQLGQGWTAEPLCHRDRSPGRGGNRYLLYGPGYADNPGEGRRRAWDVKQRLLKEFGGVIHSVLPDLRLDFKLCSVPDLKGSCIKGWSLDAIRCREAWRITPPAGGLAQGQGVVVGHPDTGYTDHPGLGPALDLTRDWDEVDGGDDARDPIASGPPPPFASHGHGTITGTTIAGRAWGGIIGVAPRAQIVPFRAANSSWHLFGSHLACSIDDAVEADCHVISISLGGLSYHDGTELAIDRAVSHGLIVVAAAGNCLGPVFWPAQYPNCLAIAASNVLDEPWVRSSHGPKVFVSAPGESVWAGDFDAAHPPGPTVVPHQGTSLAAATVAGVAALWLAHFGRDFLRKRYGPERLQNAFAQHVQRTARRPTSWDTHNYGCGIIDAEKLLRTDPPAPDDVPPPTFLPPLGNRRRPTELELLAVVVPELPLAAVESNLRAILRSRAGEATAQELIDRHGPELRYDLLADPDLRDRFVRLSADPIAIQPFVGSLHLVSSDALRKDLVEPGLERRVR